MRYRIVEFDGRFTIEVLAPKFCTAKWVRCGNDGEPVWIARCGVSNQMKSFKSYKKAKRRVKSFLRGYITHSIAQLVISSAWAW